MTKIYRIVVEVTAREDDYLLDTEYLKESLGIAAFEIGWRDGGAPIVGVRLDGRALDGHTYKLEESPLNQTARDYADKGQTIQAIKEVRSATGMSLAEAKHLVDRYRENR